MTALWALVVVVNKKILESVTPVAVNFFIRLVAIAGLLLLTVPLTVFGLWDNGFGINAEAAGWIALSAVATWLVAFNAYYYALRGERVAVIAPICSTDPIWTALFAWLLARHRARRRHPRRHGAWRWPASCSSRAGWAKARRPEGELAGAAALAGAAHGDVLPDGAGRRGHRGRGRRRRGRGAPSARLKLVALALLTAGRLGPGPRASSTWPRRLRPRDGDDDAPQPGAGALMLGGVLLLRRTPLAARPLTPAARRRAILAARGLGRPARGGRLACSSTSASSRSARC